MQIFSYTQFINEAVINYDNDLKSRLDKLSNHHDKDVSMVANSLLDIINTDIDSKTLRNDKYQFKIGNTEQTISLDGKNDIKIGRLLGILLPNIPDHIKGKFASAFGSESTPNKSSGFEVVSGNDIEKYYRSDNSILRGTLSTSCMLDVGAVLSIYTMNPNSVSLLIYKENGGDKISGRAILWKLTNSDTFNFMDRIYYSSDDIEFKFQNWAIDNNLIFRQSQSNENRTVIDKNGRSYSNIEVKLDTIDFKQYPYCDTLSYLDLDTKILTNKPNGKSKRYYKLGNTGGTYELVDNNVFSIIAEQLNVSVGLLRRRGEYIDVFQTSQDLDDGNMESSWIIKSTEQIEVDSRNFFYENISDFDIDYSKYLKNPISEKSRKESAIKLCRDFRFPHISHTHDLLELISIESGLKINKIIRTAIVSIAAEYKSNDINNIDINTSLVDYLQKIHTTARASDNDRSSAIMYQLALKIENDVHPILEQEVASNIELQTKLCSLGESWIFDNSLNWSKIVDDLMESEYTTPSEMFGTLYFMDLRKSQEFTVEANGTNYYLGRVR